MFISLVLAGGMSTRMGRDKGLIKITNSTWVELAYQKIDTLGFPVYVSLNATQLAVYSGIFSGDKFIIDNSPAEGPLRGILSAHNQFPDKDIIVLAVDIIEMQTETLQTLISECKNNYTDYDFFSYKKDNFFEPLCAVYTSKGLKKIQHALDNNQLNTFSFQQIFKSFATYSIPIEKDKEEEFKNYNTL